MKIWIAVMTGKFVIKDDLSILDCNDSNTHGIKVLLSEYRALDRRLTDVYIIYNEIYLVEQTPQRIHHGCLWFQNI